MTQQEKTTTWVIVIIVAIIIIGLGWWYFAMQSNSTTTTTTNTPTTGQQVQSSQKDIVSFVLPGKTPAAIDNTNHTILIKLTKGSDVTQLAPTITVSDAATVSPASSTAQDFTHPVIYTVTAQDGSVQNYTVTVQVSAT